MHHCCKTPILSRDGDFFIYILFVEKNMMKLFWIILFLYSLTFLLWWNCNHSVLASAAQPSSDDTPWEKWISTSSTDHLFSSIQSRTLTALMRTEWIPDKFQCTDKVLPLNFSFCSFFKRCQYSQCLIVSSFLLFAAFKKEDSGFDEVGRK